MYVHILQSRDSFRFPLCFTSTTKPSKQYVFEFTTESDVGLISCVVPDAASDAGVSWRSLSVINVSDELDKSQWSSAMCVASLTRQQFADYQRWLLTWLTKNKYYTLLEDGSNIRKFIADSLENMKRLGAVLSRDHLFLPDVYSYNLSYENKERCGPGDMHTIKEWYAMLLEHYSGASMYRWMNTLNEMENIYYHESTPGGERYWLITKPKFTISSYKIPSNDGGRVEDMLTAFAPAPTLLLPTPVPDTAPTQPQLFMSTPLPVAVAAPIAVANTTTTTATATGSSLLGGGSGSSTMLVIIILVAILIIIIFIAIIYFASTPTVHGADVTHMFVV